MALRFYADEFRCAIYIEAPGGGDPLDPESLMNRPVVNPLDWLENIRFHSDLDYYGVVTSTLSTPITHPTINGISRSAAGGSGDVSTFVTFFGQSGSSDHLLLTHDLGYIPDFYAIQNGQLVPNGVTVQRQDNARMRWASVYATETEIRVRTFGYSSEFSLSSVTVNYGVIVFRQHAPVPEEDMLNLEPGNVVFGQGLFKSGEPHLRTTGGVGSVFSIAKGPTVFLRNGGFRAWLPDGSFSDWGAYNGTSSPPQFINIEVGK